MVKIKKIKVLNKAEDYFDSQYDILFTGQSIDDRTTYINSVIESKCDKRIIHQVKIDIKNYSMHFNTVSVSILRLRDYLFSFKPQSANLKVFIETTTLDFSEILYLLYGFQSLGQEVEIVLSYVEPDDYNNSRTHLKEKDEFLLSDSLQKFTGLPLFSINSQDREKSHLVALLGFENHRLGQVLEEDDGSSFSNLISMIGIPAFKPGWENRSIHRHIEYFGKLKTSMQSYPATNPYELNLVLEKLYRAYEKISIASMGTKPAALAAAVFLVNNISKNSRQKHVGAIYDFPNKSIGRSTGVGTIYKYDITITSVELLQGSANS